MPFPTVISRICPALCEFDCRRLIQDESVAINHLKRFVCDYEMDQDERIQPYSAPTTDKRIALIGGGVQGLAAAYFSTRLGHNSTVYEGTCDLGGILRKAISRERLSMDILDWDIQGIADLGVEMKTNQKAGVDFTIPSLLREGYDAVFTASGGWDSRLANNDVGTAATVIPGTYLLIDLLRSKEQGGIKVEGGETVVIAGDGARLPDAVDILQSRGAKKIWVISRKKPMDSSFNKVEIEDLAESGVTILYNTGITKIMGQEGDLTGIEYIELDTGVEHVIDTDSLIIGSGRCPELAFVPIKDDGVADENTEQTEAQPPLIWEGVELQKKPDLNREKGLLSSQDVISEYTSAVAAINGGRKAATLMHCLMYKIEQQDPERMIAPKSMVQNIRSLEQVGLSPRNVLDSAGSSKERGDQLSTGFSDLTAQEEANRCLRCGLVCYEKK